MLTVSQNKVNKLPTQNIISQIVTQSQIMTILMNYHSTK